MSYFKIRLRKADRLFTKLMKILQSNACQRCGKIHPENSMNLGVSHFFGRWMESTRFDEDNGDLMCNMPCHTEWEHEKKEGREYHQFMINKLGQDRFDLLEIRANGYHKRDDKLEILILEERLKALLYVKEVTK